VQAQRIVEAQQTVVAQSEHRSGGELLAGRADVEHRVRRQRHGALDVGEAVPLGVDQLAVHDHADDASRSRRIEVGEDLVDPAGVHGSRRPPSGRLLGVHGHGSILHVVGRAGSPELPRSRCGIGQQGPVRMRPYAQCRHTGTGCTTTRGGSAPITDRTRRAGPMLDGVRHNLAMTLGTTLTKRSDPTGSSTG
jgi:hypothetical protein